MRCVGVELVCAPIHVALKSYMAIKVGFVGVVAGAESPIEFLSNSQHVVVIPQRKGTHVIRRVGERMMQVVPIGAFTAREILLVLHC